MTQRFLHFVHTQNTLLLVPSGLLLLPGHLLTTTAATADDRLQISRRPAHTFLAACAQIGFFLPLVRHRFDPRPFHERDSIRIVHVDADRRFGFRAVCTANDTIMVLLHCRGSCMTVRLHLPTEHEVFRPDTVQQGHRVSPIVCQHYSRGCDTSLAKLTP